MRVAALFACALAVVGVIEGCADHSNDPKSCRERVAGYISTVYPDPANLAKALDAICGITPILGTEP